MKVLDLECSFGHGFEGWFGSEQDFQEQLQLQLVQCPVCTDSAVRKRPSAPRLNLSHPRSTMDVATAAVLPTPEQDAQAQVLRALRAMVQQSVDVGDRFADEARRMHTGEVEPANIRGQATLAQARELLADGVPILPVPDVLKEPLH